MFVKKNWIISQRLSANETLYFLYFALLVTRSVSDVYNYGRHLRVNLSYAELYTYIFHHLKLELLTQFPASNDEKYV